MEEKLHSELIKKIDGLKALVGNYSISSLLNTVAMEMRKQSFPDQEDSKLVSPAKQCFYLIGILQQSEEPTDPKILDEVARDILINSLNDIFQYYALIFWPTEEEKDQLTEEWRRCREVAMPVFLHYFNTSLIASVEQISDRIKDSLIKFDDEISKTIGISVTKCLDFCDAIAKLQQNNLDQLYQDAEKEKELRLGLLDKAEKEGWGLEQLKEETAKSEYSGFIQGFLDQMNNLFVFCANDLGFDQEEVRSFLTAFSLSRGEGIEFTYITEDNPAELRPIILSEDEKYFCPSINTLYIALLNQFEGIILEGEYKERYLTNRDKLLEKKGERLFLALLDDGAASYNGLYESKDLHYEHDTIIISGRNLYLIEAKASPPLEPFRDPEKAYTRIKRHFRSDRGIQKGFEQADRIRERLVNDGEVNLYDKDSNLVLALKSENFDNVFPICLTRDDFGPIATNLNLLLEKDNGAPYPWVVNEFDLESLIQGYKHLDLSEDDFVAYLNDRIRLHGKLFGTDELEYVGFSLKHGGLKHVIEIDTDMIILSPHDSDIFDEIYLSEKVGEKVELNITKPDLIGVKEAMYESNIDPAPRPKDLVKRDCKKKRNSKRKMVKQSRKKNRRK